MNSEKNKNVKNAVVIRGDRTGVFRYGLIIGVFILLIDVLRAAFLRSGLFRVLTDADGSDPLPAFSLPEGKFTEWLKKLSERGRRARMRVVRFISVSLESSGFLRWLKKCGEVLLNTTARTYGMLLGAYGIISAAVLYFRSTVGLPELADRSSLNTAAGILCLGVVLLWCSDKKLITLVSGCVMTGTVFCVGLDFLPEKLRPSGVRGLSVGAAAAIGALLGLFSFLVSPLVPPAVIALLLLLTLILIQPEIGIVATVAILPFTAFSSTPETTLCGLTFITAFSYGVRLLTRRRVARFEKIDLGVLLVLFAVLSGAVFSIPGSASAALLYAAMILFYFLFVAMMRDRMWLRVCSAALLIPATLAALLNVLGFLIGLLPSESALGTSLTDVLGGLFFIFESTDSFAVYLTMVIPFALGAVLSGAKPAHRRLFAAAAIVMFADIVLLRSRSAWFGLLCGCSFFVLLTVPRALAVLPPLGAIVGLAAYGYSDVVGTPLANFFALPGNSLSYREKVWTGVLDMIRKRPVFGYGIGSEVFREAYVDFAVYGAENASHAYSVYLQVVFALGLFGFAVMMAALTSGAVSAFSFLAREKRNTESYLTVSSGLGAMVSVLTAGIFNYTWIDIRVFFLFCLMAGITAASVRVGRRGMAAGSEESFSAGAADTVL